MKEQVLLDTNIVIEILNGTGDPHSFDEYDVFISTITVAELYALSGISKDEERRIDVALLFLSIVPPTKEIAKRAGVLARTWTKRSQRPDLLIAATALELGVPLITKNVRDFARIRGLVVRSKP